MRRAVRWSPVLRVAEWWVGGGPGVSSQRGAQRPQHLVRPSWRWSTPSVPTPDGQSYLQRYKTVFGKTVATVRHTLNRFQPFSADHRFTLVSWGVLGGVWWILAGSTTFVSLLIWLVPSDEFQLWVAAQVSKHVTRYAGAEVTFGSAIQPTWKTLRFNDVRVVRTCEMTGVPNAMELDVTIQQLDVRISLLWLLEGKGLVEEAVVHGVRGVLNRRTSWDQYDERGQPIPWAQQRVVPPEERWRCEWYRGSFHLAKCVVTDAVLTLYQPEPTRPLRIVVHSFTSSRLRRQWLAFDLLSSTMDGSFDGRLFSLRAPPNMASVDKFQLMQLHMDGTNMDVVKGGATGPLTWLTEGNLDLDALMYLPRVTAGDERERDEVKIHVRMRLSNLSAAVPLRDSSISYLNAALVQPMVVYLNTNYVSVPLEAWLHIPMRFYNGAWTPYSAAMTDALSEAVGVELAKKVADQKRPRNLLWLAIKGVEGVWRAAKHGLYIASAYAMLG